MLNKQLLDLYQLKDHIEKDGAELTARTNQLLKYAQQHGKKLSTKEQDEYKIRVLALVERKHDRVLLMNLVDECITKLISDTLENGIQVSGQDLKEVVKLSPELIKILGEVGKDEFDTVNEALKNYFSKIIH